MIRSSQYLHAPQAPLPLCFAATVVLLRDGQKGGEDNLEVLISKRAARSSFVPSMYVFPGGRVDAEDEAWAQHWQALFPAAWPARVRAQALAAVRECFEEMGVQLVRTAAGDELGAQHLTQVQRAAPLFAQWAEQGWQPDIGNLLWVCDRLPDTTITPRYHTAFFYAIMPAGQVVQPDMHEQLDAVWLPVADPVWKEQGQDQSQSEQPHAVVYPMIYPTLKTLEALLPHSSVAAAWSAAQATTQGNAQQGAPHYQTRAVLHKGQIERVGLEHLAYAEAELVCPDGQVQHGIDWQYEKPVPLLRHVQRLTCANPSMMTGPGTNTYLIGTPAQGFVVLDAGPRNKAHVRRILQATDGRIHSLLCTHSHPDHSPGAQLLYRFLRRKGRAVPLFGMASLPTAAAHSRFVPTVQVQDGQVIHLPAQGDAEALTLQLIHTPGHAANHVCVLLQEDGLLFSGDHILSGSTTVIAPPDGDMTAYLDALDKLDAACARFDVQFILPAHGHVLGGAGSADPSLAPESGAGARRIIAYYRQHRLGREAKVIAAMRQLGVQANTPEIRQQLLPIAYADAPPALWPVAVRSLDAHIARILDLRLLAKA